MLLERLTCLLFLCIPKASIVLGDDRDVLELELAGSEWHVDRTLSFNAAAATASLRLHPGRTACQGALPEKEDADGNAIAVFVFACADGDYRHLELDLGAHVPLAYRRAVAPSIIADGSIPCTESGVFARKGTIGDVDPEREDVFLYPGFPKYEPRWSGILVNELVEKRSEAVVKISRDDLGELFLRQAAAGKASAPPVLSDNWRLRVQQALEKRGVNDVAVGVRR